MICWRVCDIIKCFARNNDDVRLTNFKRMCGLDSEWKLLRQTTRPVSAYHFSSDGILACIMPVKSTSGPSPSHA